MRIRPREERLYAVLDPVVEFTTEGGIIVPSRHSERSRLGTVKEVGPDVKDIKVGDRVLVHFMAGIWVDLYDKDVAQSNDTHRIFTASEIMAIIEE